MRSQLVSGERILCTQGGIFVLFQDSLAFDSLTVVYLGVDLLSSSHLDFVEILGYRDYCTPGVRFQEILCKFLAIISLVSFCSFLPSLGHSHVWMLVHLMVAHVLGSLFRFPQSFCFLFQRLSKISPPIFRFAESFLFVLKYALELF